MYYGISSFRIEIFPLSSEYPVPCPFPVIFRLIPCEFLYIFFLNFALLLLSLLTLSLLLL